MIYPIDEYWRPDLGLYWPPSEPDDVFKTMIRRVTDIDVVLQHVKTKGVAVQAGGFVGMWPTRLIKFFERVYTFEPIPSMYRFLVMNTKHHPGIICRNAALGENFEPTRISYKIGGGSEVVNAGDLTVETYTVDALDLPRCDLIYLDVERSELRALAGAKRTIEKFHPVVVLEFKGDTEKDYIHWARDNGYEVVGKIHSDMILRPLKW